MQDVRLRIAAYPGLSATPRFHERARSTAPTNAPGVTQAVSRNSRTCAPSMAARLHTAPDEADRDTVGVSELLQRTRRHRGRAVRRVPCRHRSRLGPGRPSATLKFELRGPRRDTPRRRRIESFKEKCAARAATFE